MKDMRRKWTVLAAAGSIIGMAMLFLLRSVPVAAESAAVAVAAIIFLKHLALTIVIGSPLTALFRSVKPKIRSHCPFAKP